MKKLSLLALACTPCLMFTGRAAADMLPILYDVNTTVDSASVVGTITTDGAEGPLSTVDILDFHLMLSAGGSEDTLTKGVNGDSVFIGSGGLVATSQALSFNFNNGAFVNFFSTATCTPLWALRAGGGTTCNGLSATPPTPGSTPTLNAIALSATNVAMISPNVTSLEITTGATVVPEPGSTGLIVAGLVSLIGFRKLRL